MQCELTGAALTSTVCGGVTATCTTPAAKVSCYAPHSFSVQTSKERLTLAKHVHAIGQLVSHSRPLLGQLVHVNFLAPVSYRVLGRRAFVAEAVRCYAPHSFSVQTSKERLTLAKHVHAIGQ